MQDKEVQYSKTFAWGFSLVACLLACVLYYHFKVNNCLVEVELEVSQRTPLKIYWSEKGEPYSEKKMAVVFASPHKRNYSFYLTNIADVQRLRIDTHRYEGKARLRKLLFSQHGWRPQQFDASGGFDQLVPLNQIADYRIDNSGLLIHSSGDDPNFELILQPEYTGKDPQRIAMYMVGISFAVLLIIYFGRYLLHYFQLVPILLFGVWVLVFTMAGISKKNVHPDEYVHMAAVAYYQDNWLPPLIEDPAIKDSFSAYGKSWLNNSEIYSLFAGKVYKIAKLFQVSDTLALRCFNVLSFGLIVLFAIKSVYARMVALPFLISPQIWYVFSYCGSDAFALFISFFTACQLINPESLLHNYLKNTAWAATLAGIIFLPLLLGVVFLLKVNYYPFIGLFYLVLGIKLFFSEEYYWERKQAIGRLFVITLLGLAVYGGRIGLDYMVNGPDKKGKIIAMMEERATGLYKPSLPLEEKHITLFRKARGTTFKDMGVRLHWFEQTFKSGFGVFGYLTISAEEAYYDLVRILASGLGIFFCLSMLFRGGVSLGIITATTITLSAMLLGASFYNSWVYDFQPQGRYLFPVVPMAGIVMGLGYKAINRPLLYLGVFSLFCTSLYCFVFLALLKIPKVVF